MENNKKFIFSIILIIILHSFANVTNTFGKIIAADLSNKNLEPKVKSITLSSPNGGEIWQAGTTQVIKWVSTEVEYVKISYSTNNGLSWQNVTSGYAASWQQYWWDIPENITPSQEFRIRVSDDSDPTVFDISDNKLTLSKIIVTAPSASISFQTERVDTIKWVASSDIDSVDIEISFNNGSFTFIKRVAASVGKYAYTVPNTPSRFNKVRIKNYNNTSVYYTTDYFRIARLKLTSPNGGEDWLNGTSQSIIWNSVGITNVKIEYSLDAGVTWNTIINNQNATPNIYSWTIPNVGTESGLVRISDANEANIYDISDSYFRILKLYITSPHDSTGWKIGSLVNIEWSTNLSENVKLEISTNNGISWTEIATNIPASNQSYTYLVPNSPTNEGKIRISSLANSNIKNISEGTFTIGNVSITAPIGGVWQAGSQQNITWISEGIKLVKLEYTTNNGGTWVLINSSYDASSQSYPWSIPSTLSSTNVKIRINDAETNNNALQDISSSFTVSNLQITSPVNGDVFSSGSVVNITWTASPTISNVRLEYKTESDNDWIPINNNNPILASLGSYNWTTPINLSGELCQIRITAVDNPSIKVTNDGYFKVGYLNLIKPNGGEKLVGNSVYQIRWNNSNSVQSVRLEYSLDGGTSYITIPEGFAYPAASGSFSWTVPNIVSNNVKVRISDAYAPNKIRDESDNNFSIAELTLTYPNGGEGFYPGQAINITWNVTNISNVNLAYRVGNGNWVNIVQGIASVPKQYNWVIPNSITGDFDIKISAAEDTSLYDIGDGKSKIANIQVKYPSEAGIILQAGRNVKIQWSYTNNVNNVILELSTDNGVNWNYITTRPASDSLYNYILPNLGSTQALIRVTDADNSAINDISDNVFIIKQLELSYPNGGEYFLADSTINVTWNSSNITNVKISYSVDSLQNVIPITTVAAVPAFYSWKIPNNPSNRVVVKVEDADNIALNISDVSNRTFSIGTIYLISPNGGQSFTAGSNQVIRWQAHSSVQKIRIELTTNGGSSWQKIVDSLDASPSSYIWTVPPFSSTNCKIRITDVANPSGLTTRDQSDTPFAIGSILLTSPNGGERYQAGTKKNINWINISSVSKVNLDYSTNNGLSWTNIVSNYDAPLETYEWTIPDINVPGAGFIVRITNVADTTIKDVSDNPFTIANLTVTTPNGNEIYQVGKNLPISWSSYNVGNISLEYSYNNGTTWLLVNGDIPSGEGQYNSYVLPDVPSTQALVRIFDNSDPTILDRSNTTFKILRLKLTSPTGGESYKIGTNKLITWNSGGIGTVDIQLTTDDGLNWYNVVSNYPASTGFFSWSIPNLPTNNLKIKIIDVANPTISDSSTSPITLGSITVTQPSAGEVLKANSVKTISWTATTGINAVKLEFSSDNGATWEVIENSIPATPGNYNWIVKDVATSSGLIRVSHAVSVTDLISTSGNFIINKLSLTSPNGGEYWQAGTTKNISWTSSIAGNLKIEYSLDNGNNWNLIVSPVAANLGNYAWSLPINLSSKQALIKITDLSNPNIKDSSDLAFTIGNVSITNIAGGENFQTNSSKVINFTTSSSVTSVNFEYTLDEITWTPFALGIPANAGSVIWNIGNIASSNKARIRISDAQSNLNIANTTNYFNVVSLKINQPNGGELLQAGKTTNIRWEASEQVAFVNIFYSTDNGQNWVSIANNVISLPNVVNNYAWSIPANITGTSNLIRITNANDPTILTSSSNNFTICSISFIKPIVSTNWQSNTRNRIEWNSQNAGNVKLEYSLDNGTSWNTIINSYNSNLQFYNWDIPQNIFSNQALVKITSNVNSTVAETTSPFKIKQLDLKIPNGGETWKAGTPRNITWDANLVNSLTIYLSSDNGQTWNNTPIAQNISGSGGLHTWLIPADYFGKNYKIKLVDDDANNIKDSSNAAFTINSFALTSPAGGEVWQAGSTHNITWTVSNVNEVLLEYSLNNGATWNTIISNLNAELKQYAWTIPDVSSNQARIRITDAQDITNYYVSNPFKISSLKLTSPNGGELWQAGTTKPITWSSSNVNNVNIEYSLDNGTNWQNIATNINAGLLSYNWNIPLGISSQNVRVRIYDTDNPTIVDISDSKFTIALLEITNPISGSQFQAGKTATISWNTSNIGLINLLYSLDDGLTWTAITSNINSSTTNSYLWNIPSNISSNKAKIKIQSVDDPAISISTGAFKISNIVITSPNTGNEIWKAGDINPITWTSNFIDNIKIEYTTNGGTNWNTIINNVAANLGTYNWQTPNNLSGELKLRISDVSNSSIYDENDNTFSLRYIYVLFPNGGEVLQAGMPVNIQYSYSSNVSLVNVLYSNDNGTTWNTITSGSVAASGEYNYTFPLNSPNTTNGLIRIVDANAPAIINDQSDAVFTLSSLLLTSPNGNEQLQVGKQTNITWVAGSSINKIALEYFTETKGWKLIADNINANLGTYLWTIPNDPSNVVKVRIKNMENTAINDISDNTFRIADVAVTIPNTNLRWQTGRTKIITWNKTSNVKYVNIEYSIDGGINWKTPIALMDSSSNNQYKWLVPDDTTIAARIKVTDASSGGNIFDVSDVNFVISKLEVTQPDGGLPILSGATQQIKWVSTQDIDSVFIKLSLDNGVTWSTLTKQKANKNTYLWNVPGSANTDNAYIIVQDTKESTIIDTSNKFKIIPANLTLTYPVGGENLQEGRAYNIRWSKSNAVQKVKIEITTDNGTTWNLIVSDYPADSLKYSYIIPSGYFSNNSKVRITDALNNFVSSVSNSTFNIYGLNLTSFNQPNQHYKIGDTKAITWQSTSNLSQINIEYSTTEGVWKPIASNITANLGTYNWTIPNDPSNTIKIRLTHNSTSEIYSISEYSFRTANVSVVSPNLYEKWQVNRTKKIKWTYTNNVNSVNLYYSTNNGTSWVAIGNKGIEAAGEYDWTVPDFPSQKALIKVEDNLAPSSINDICDTVFVISKLEVTEPEANVVWASGDQKQIKWISSDDIDTVGIYISLDDGNIWSSLAKVKASQKLYNWIIPYAINSSNVRILINDTKYTNINDTTGKFTIYPPLLKITTPNGGEYIQGGKNYLITWQSSADIQNVRIQYRLSPSSNWLPIIQSYPADSLKYVWSVPIVTTDSAQIKITDVLQPFVTDSSDNVFKIGYVTVLEPNGGEHVQAGKNMLIRWSNSSNINNVKIDYSIDGTNYITIVNSIPAAPGNYTWTIPNLSTTTAYIRVSDASSNNAISDINDNPFTISLLQLLTPNSNIQLLAGTNYLIKWNASNEIQNINLEYSIDGTTWNRIGTIAANLGEYIWLIPNNLCSVSGKLRIWDNSSFNIMDTSKYQITFKQLNIVLPMGNENWQVGTTHDIVWSSCLIDTVNLEYSINNGINWIRIKDNLVANSGKYVWTIPNTPSQEVLVRLVDKTNPMLISVSNKFTIFNPSLKIITPNGGEIWQAGSSKTITWQQSYVNYVKVEFSSDSGKTWSVLRSSIAADSFFVWNPIPPTLETKGAVIKISDVLNSHIKDSSLVFTITQLKLLAPLGGEYWQSGTTQKIKWHAGEGINTINLEYSTNNGQVWESIEGAQNYIAAVDSFMWNVPSTGSNAVKVRIRETYDPTIYSVSPDTFTIGWVNVVSPNGGEVTQAGYPLNIKWQNSENIKTVKVEIFNVPKNQIVSWTEVSSALKQINIVIPSNYSADSLSIRLSASNSNYSIVDYSDNYFRCMMLNLLTPVIGSNWRALTEKNITWEASNNNNTVRLEFSSDAGVTWSNIITNIPANQLSYKWNVPNSVSTNCIVRIVNEDYTNVKDSSGIFTIFIPEITLLSPNGGEYYKVGKTYKIKWNNTFVTTVKIEFSSDNGSSWEVIKSQIASSVGEWDWTIVNKNWSTKTGLIRISDYTDSNIKDVSMANFTIGWIDVISPDGGENWMSNSSKTIKWDNSNSVSFVNIYYNSGLDTNWIQVAVNYPANSKQFVWQQVSSVETNRGKIKITDSESGGEITDLSQNYFLITKLFVIEPNGGEVYYKGNTYQIKWTQSININALRILLSTDGGKNYNKIISNSYPSASGYYNWVIPEDYYTDSAKIKLVNAEDTTIAATSQGFFTLGNLQLLVFNTAEKVLEKSVKKIVWESSQNISKVDLYYWTKNKIKIPIKIGHDARLKSYDWLVPEDISDSCYIAIYDHNNYRFYDTCNAPFTICRLRLLNPAGNEVWKIGDSKEFVWEAAYIGKVNIEFITDDSLGTPVFSASPYKINDLPINASLGRFSKVIDRNILGMVPSKYVRIRLIESGSKEKLADTCNQTITISEINITYPNGGEVFGKIDSIKWECSTNTIENVNLWYKRDDMTNWRLIAKNIPANSDYYKWTIKNIDPAQNYRIKIEDANADPKYRDINDLSNDPFTICDINLTYPNGNEKLKVGKTYQIKWNSSFVNLVRLEYSTDDGQNWLLVSNDPISASQKSFDWVIPDDFSRKVRVRVSDYDKHIINDLSDTTFTIADIRLINPNELIALNAGANYTINWESQNVDTVRIQLSTDNGRNWVYNLVNLPAEGGTYNWKIPSILTTQAKLRVVDKFEANISDTSNSHFVIGKFPIVKAVKTNQSSIIKFFYEFLTPQETIVIDRFEFQIGDGPIINNIESLINPPFSITGPINDTLYWRSSDRLNNMEGVAKIYIKFRSPQFNVNYDIFIDSVAFDNKAPEFDRNSVKFYQMPEKYGWNQLLVKWNKATDLSSNIYYKINVFDINNEYLNYTKITKDDSLIIPNITTSVNYKVKLDVYDDFKNTNNFTLPDYKAIALGDFAPQDGVLDARDLANFVYMWSSKDSSKAVDFAPYDGTFPFIKVKGDNKLNVDDLLAFVNNWIYAIEYTLPKKNQFNLEASDIERTKITFRMGENKFNFPINYKEKDILAITAIINYPTDVFEFDSLSVAGLSKDNGLSFVKIDSLTGLSKIDFAELYDGLKGNYSIAANIKCNFDKISKKDSLSIRYFGVKANGEKVFDKTTVYTLNEIPAKYNLYQNYPNPFNPTTTIEYDLPEKTKVALSVYDILGREVTVLVNEEQEIGTYRIMFDAAKIRNGLASGVYLLRMSTNNYKITKKMLLLK
jgi:hypothetical protein